jgi:hypothetical protein
MGDECVEEEWVVWFAMGTVEAEMGGEDEHFDFGHQANDVTMGRGSTSRGPGPPGEKPASTTERGRRRASVDDGLSCCNGRFAEMELGMRNGRERRIVGKPPRTKEMADACAVCVGNTGVGVGTGTALRRLWQRGPPLGT